MFVLRWLGLLFGLLAGVVTSQLPEFAQQYRQRLGGAIDELQRAVNDFDRDARTNQMTRSQGLDRLAGDPDPFVSQRGKRMREAEVRLARLRRQDEAIKASGPVGRIVAMTENFDPDIANRAYAQFEPAVPVTTEGLLAGLAGFLAGLGLWKLIGWPFGRIRRRLSPRQRYGRQRP